MADHVEWVRATAHPAEIIAEGEEFSDNFGNHLDEGNIGLYVGDGSGCAVVEGTRDEVRAWLQAALALLVPQANDPGVPPQKCEECGGRHNADEPHTDFN